MTSTPPSVPTMPPVIPPLPHGSNVPSADAPIADLSYRNYDGPLHSRAIRWWTIAVAMFKLNLKSTAYRIVGILGVLPYLFIIALLYIQGRLSNNGKPIAGFASALMDNTVGQKYALQFYNALGYQLLYLLIISIIAGAGSIASDNRNNALLIYLSRPITKNDYLLGKWVGLFLTVFLVAFGPAFLLYFYCLCSYYADGFLKEEPMLLFHVIACTGLASAVFTSIILGLSAWSKSPRITGAILAGMYFASQILSFAIWQFYSRGKMAQHLLMQHASIGGIVSGLSQAIYGVTIHMTAGNRNKGFRLVDIPPPNPGIIWLCAIAMIVIGVGAARLKIRAVEVIS